MIAHPSDADVGADHGHRIAAAERPDELDAIEAFVARGGGLIVLGETEQDKYGNNLNELLERFGLRLENDTVQDYEHYRDAPSWVLADLQHGGRGTRRRPARARRRGLPVPGDDDLIEQRRASCSRARIATASVPGAPLIVASTHGEGRVVVLADSDLFGDDCIGELDHRALWLNLCYWAARPDGGVWPVARRPRRTRTRARPGVGRGCATRRTRSRCCRRPTARCSATRTRRRRGHVEAMAQAIEELAPRFPHDARVSDRGGRGPARVGLRQARLHARARAVPARADRAPTGSSTSCSSRCTSRTARATPASRR